MGLVVNNQ